MPVGVTVARLSIHACSCLHDLSVRATRVLERSRPPRPQGQLSAGCTSTPDIKQVSLPVPQAAEQADLQPAETREHLRILASYGGIYENARLQAEIGKTVDRLVAASERPNLKYNVTILNSPAINAFALPSGHLYVTRGLIALANDKAELASVLAHEMGHVIANHAEIREDQARQAALIGHVVSDVLSDPQMGALALAKSKYTLAAFSRAQEFEADGIGVGISARAGFDPYGASRFLADMQRNADLKPAGSSDTRPPDFLVSHPATPERVKTRSPMRASSAAPAPANAIATNISAISMACPTAKTRAKASCAGGVSCIPSSASPFWRHRDFHSTIPRKRCSASRKATRRCGSTWSACRPRQTLPDYLKSGWMEKVDPASVEPFAINGFTAATATARGDDWSFRLFAVRFGSDVYRFIFAAKTWRLRSIVVPRMISSFRRMSLQESAQVHPLRLKIVSVGAKDTVELLAHRMATADHALDRFRVLNGLGPNDTLKPGAKVKMVVD